MSNFDLKMTKETFARLFVVALDNKMNLSSFIEDLSKSAFIQRIESKEYDESLNRDLLDVFASFTKRTIAKDNSYGVYNDAYWCGSSYFELHLRLNRPFSYIFLKLPLEELLGIYSIYHEMDISHLMDYFQKKEKETTILRALCKKKKCSITKLSIQTGINAATLNKYNADDEALYKGSFQNIYKISQFFQTPINLFYKE